MEPQGESLVYVEEAGVLKELKVSPGDQVSAGQALAILENKELNSSYTELVNRYEHQENKLEVLKNQALLDSSSSSQIPAEQETFNELKVMLAERAKDLERLTLRAKQSGIVVIPRAKRSQKVAENQLDQMRGTAFDEKNQNAYLPLGTLFCLFGTPDQLEATILVEQSNIELISRDQEVAFQFDHYAGKTFHRKTTFPQTDALEKVPEELTSKMGRSDRNETRQRWCRETDSNVLSRSHGFESSE